MCSEFVSSITIMNPTRDLDTADFSLHRVIFSSRRRLQRTFSESTDFKCSIDIPRSQNIFRFALRRVTFPNVANPWDLKNPPYVYFRAGIEAVTGMVTNMGVYRVKLSKAWTSKSQVAGLADTYNVPNGINQLLTTNAELYTNELAAFLPGSTAFTEMMAQVRVYFESESSNMLFIKMASPTIARFQFLGVSDPDAGGDQELSHYGNNILGISKSTQLLGDNDDHTCEFPVNLTGMLHVYLTSTTLTATARSMRPMFAPVENCLMAIPVASTYLTMVDHRPEAPTIWSCNQDNTWDVVDFQLRYDSGGLVDLGGNDIEIEVEFEVMEKFNEPLQQMKEAIYMPVVNVHDTSKLLIKRDNRSWGSYTGTSGTRQFTTGGYTSRVFR